jgi:hypothetical protein
MCSDSVRSVTISINVSIKTFQLFCLPIFKHWLYQKCFVRTNLCLSSLMLWVRISIRVRCTSTLSEHMSSHFLLCQSTWFHTSYPVTAHEFTLLTLSEHMRSHFLACQSTWVHTSCPARAHEFTLLTLSEHISSHFLPCQSTWVHTSYPVTAQAFTLLTLSEHMSSHFLPCQSTWVHTSFPVRAPDRVRRLNLCALTG